LRRLAEAAGGDAGATIRSGIPQSWPWRPLFAGKRLLVFGGKSRASRVEQFERALGAASVEWVESEGRSMSLTPILDVIRGGRYDAAFVLSRFAGANAA